MRTCVAHAFGSHFTPTFAWTLEHHPKHVLLQLALHEFLQPLGMVSWAAPIKGIFTTNPNMGKSGWAFS